jgi:hypothetical protein
MMDRQLVPAVFNYALKLSEVSLKTGSKAASKRLDSLPNSLTRWMQKLSDLKSALSGVAAQDAYQNRAELPQERRKRYGSGARRNRRG